MKKNLFVSFGLLLLCSAGWAQAGLTNKGQLYITGSADTLFVGGSMQNTSTASLQNVGGNIMVKQDLQNDQASMSAGGGKLWFTGTVQQNIAGSQPFRTYSWIVNNNAGVALANRIGIGDGTGGSLNFVNGTITSGTALQDVYFYPGSSYTGYTDNAHIIGYCSKSGSTNFTFPIGTGTIKADLDITNLSAASDFQVKYFGTGYGDYTAAGPLVSIFRKEYWTLDRTAGAASAQITLKWNDARKTLNHGIPSDLRVGHFTGGIWVSEGGTGSGDTPTGTVTSNAVSNYSPFTFASVGVLLPVQLTDFKIQMASNCSYTARWTTADESSVLQYQLQRSADGMNWEDLRTIPATRTSSPTYTYEVEEIQPLRKGSWYFRVMALQQSGERLYTGIQTVQADCGSKSVKAFPTITRDQFIVSNSGDEPLKSIRIIAADGKWMRSIPVTAGSMAQTVSLGAYPAGLYHIQVETSTQRYRFLITRQ